MNESPTNANPGHEFQFRAGELFPLFIPSAVAFAGLVLLLHALNGFNWLPTPEPALTGDEFVMKNRFEKALSNDPAEVLIIGDSSSVMGVDASALTGSLPGNPPAYNFGLFLGLPLEVYAEPASMFIEHHPEQVRLVVLLTTFSRLEDGQHTPQSLAYWRNLTNLSKGPSPAGGDTPMHDLFLVQALGERFLPRLLPFVAHGEIGVFYGNTVLSRKFLSERAGSAFSRGVYNRNGASGKIRWGVEEGALKQSLLVRKLIPANVALAFAVMPAPESYVTSDSIAQRRRVMAALNSNLQADYLLFDLLTTMPDGYFSDLVHLNLRGQEQFTRLLAAELAKLPVWDKR